MNTQQDPNFTGNTESDEAGRRTAGSTEETDQSQAEQSAKRQSQALIDELNMLGAKFAEAIDAAWKSEQRKRLEDDLRNGVVSVAQSLDQQLKDFSRREDTQKVLDKAENVADQVRSSKVSQEIAAALTQGLHTLSEHLDKMAQDFREREQDTKTADKTSDSAKASASPPDATMDDTDSPGPATRATATPGSTSTAGSTGGAADQDSGEDIPIQRG